MFAAFYWKIFIRAEAYSASQPPKSSTLDEEAYDLCGGIVDGSTQWTLILKFNAYLFTIMSALICCSFTGVIWWQVYRCVNTLLGCGNLTLWICIFFTGAYEFNTDGHLCAENTMVYDEASGASWADDGELIKALFIAQTVMALPLMCMLCLGLCVGELIGKQHDYRNDASYKRIN